MRLNTSHLETSKLEDVKKYYIIIFFFLWTEMPNLTGTDP